MRMKIKQITFLIVVFALLLFTAACGQKDTVSPAEATQAVTTAATTAEQTTAAATTTQEQPVALTVSAAASLKDAMEEIKTAYAAEKANVTLTLNLGSSGSLQQQIEQGAEVDVFIPAAVKQMDALQEKGLIVEDTRKNFLENSIVLVVPANSSAVADFKDLTSDKVKQIALGEPKSVPVGQYAEEILTKLDLLASIKDKVVYGKDVKEVLTWVETGNADAGIVYETDAKTTDKVKVAVKAPADSHQPVYYPAAVIKATKQEAAAKDFIQFLYSPAAKPIFEKYGFVFIEK